MVPIIGQTMTFSDLVETVKDLSIDEKQQLQMLLSGSQSNEVHLLATSHQPLAN